MTIYDYLKSMFVSIIYTNDEEEPVVFLVGKNRDKLINAINKKLGVDIAKYWFPGYHRIPIRWLPYKSAFYQNEFRLYITHIGEDETTREVMRRLKL